jgi:hypothetical protein
MSVHIKARKGFAAVNFPHPSRRLSAGIKDVIEFEVAVQTECFRSSYKVDLCEGSPYNGKIKGKKSKILIYFIFQHNTAE